ncbi:hypothetical protein Pmani_009623 [Petrolisthes manimaculis]|uniref:Uncharacterized protein n=1 Tax=Petrolisthes manimaculis TaxID=1843537 RepID=A0AAE1Q3V6_9EUCA|nr:hypothetical protein Pmani_009623 [Petrolisthes manimaculis]
MKARSKDMTWLFVVTFLLVRTTYSREIKKTPIPHLHSPHSNPLTAPIPTHSQPPFQPTHSPHSTPTRPPFQPAHDPQHETQPAPAAISKRRVETCGKI